MWGWLLFFIGIVYGYMTPGKQDKMDILKKGAVIGVVLGLLLGLIGLLTPYNPTGLSLGAGVLGVVVSVVVFTLIFVVGVWIGDLIEGRRTPAA